MDKLIELINKLQMWQILLVVGILLFGLGFTGTVNVLGLTLIAGMEYVAIAVGFLMVAAAVYLREKHRKK